MWDVMFIVELGVPPLRDCSWWKPGYFRSTVGGRKYRRFWWIFFAVTFYAGDQHQFGQAIESGMTEWKSK